MEGRDESADAHRHYWTQLLATVAFAPAPPADDSVTRSAAGNWPGDVAPLADLTARIGHAAGAGEALVPPSRRFVPPLWLLFVMALIALTTEWALRRTRGAP